MSTQDVVAEIVIRDMLADAFGDLREQVAEIHTKIEKEFGARAQANFRKELGLMAEVVNTSLVNKPRAARKTDKNLSEKPFVFGSNGLIRYDSAADTPGSESIHERNARERFWRSMGKKIRKGSSIR